HAASETVVRGMLGQTAQLPCFYQVKQLKDISDMCWGRGPCPNSKCSNKILDTTGNRVTFRRSQRYSLQGYISYGDVSLTIGKVKAEDAGTYCCRVEIPGWFNDIKQNIRLEVIRAPPVMRTTTRRAPIFPTRYSKTTLAPQATSDHQATTETDVHLTTTILEETTSNTNHQTTETAVLLMTTVPPVTTATTKSLAVITLEDTDPPLLDVTENYAFPETMVTTSALPDFSTGFQTADMRTEDYDMVCPTESLPLPEVTTEFPSTVLTSEETKTAHTSLMVEDLPAAVILEILASRATKSCMNRSEVNMLIMPFQSFSSPFQFPIYGILIASLTAVSILFILLLLLFHKRKYRKKFIIKSFGPAEDLGKSFQG
ncbi:TIMD4 protein, partial [Chloroceryle aenea]|nr:TIMD4 protein [Chloroceryle aenea]